MTASPQPEAAPASHPLPSSITLLHAGARLVASNAHAYYGFVGWLLIPLLFVVGAYATGGNTGVLLLNIANASMFMLLMWAFASIMWLTAALVLHPTKTIDTRYVGAIAWERTFGLVFAILVASVLELAGLLLIVPGIVIAVYLTFSAQEAVLHHRSPFAALAASRDLVRGRFWSICGRVVGLFGMTIALYTLIGVGIVGISSALGIFSPADLLTAPAPLWLEMLLNVLELSFLPIVMAAHTLLYLALENR